MNNTDSLVNLLLTNFGAKLHNKSDGRVEIPKYIIKSMGWDSCDMVYVSSDLSNKIYISDNSFLTKDAECITVAISCGRLRIPYSFLKKIGLDNRHFIVTSNLNSVLCLRVNNYNNDLALRHLLEELPDNQVNDLYSILTGSTQFRNREIPNGDLARISIHKKELPRPKLFLLDSEHSTVFRPVINPYKFSCKWVNNSPMLTKDNLGENLYIIGGINRGDNSIGFLIIDEATFGKVCYFINRKGYTTAINKDLIFMYSHMGFFKLYESPESDIEQDTVDEAKQVCANPEKFLINNFPVFQGGECSTPSGVITKHTMGEIKKE